MSEAVGVPQVQLLLLGVLATEHLVPVRVAAKHLQDLEVLEAPLAIELDQVYQLSARLPLFFVSGGGVIAFHLDLLGFGLIEQVDHVLEHVGTQLTVLYILAVHKRHDNKQALKQSIRLEQLNLVDDVLRKLLGHVIEAEGAGHASVDVSGELVAKYDRRQLAHLVLLPVSDLAVADVHQVLLEE